MSARREGHSACLRVPRRPTWVGLPCVNARKGQHAGKRGSGDWRAAIALARLGTSWHELAQPGPTPTHNYGHTMNNLFNLQPLDQSKTDRYRQLAADPRFRTASVRAAQALRNLAACVRPRDLQAHAAREKDPLGMLERLTTEVQQRIVELRALGEHNDAANRLDHRQRHRFDGVAMRLFGQYTERSRHLQSVIAHEQQEAEQVQELMAAVGLKPNEAMDTMARQALGVTARQEREAMIAIAEAQQRIDNLDRVLVERARGGSELTDGSAADLNALRGRLVAEIEGHRARLESGAEERGRLEQLMRALGRGPGTTSLSALQVECTRSALRVQEATLDLADAQNKVAALDQFLSDPKRSLDALPDNLRGELVEQDMAPRGGTGPEIFGTVFGRVARRSGAA